MAKICRACLSTNSFLLPINETFIHGYKTLTNITINNSDDLPQHTCATCLESVTKFLRFRDKCIESENTLQQILLESVDCKEDVLKTDSNLKVDYILESDLDDDHQHEDLNCGNSEENTGKESAQNNISFKNNEEYLSCSDNYVHLEEYGIKELKTRIAPVQKRKIDETTEKCIKNATNTEIKERSEILPCGLCLKDFDDKTQLNEHLDDHKNYKDCNICRENFREWPSLLSHRIEHLPKLKDKICHYCDKRYYGVYQLELHYRSLHFDGEKSLSCKYCLKKVNGARNLKRHINQNHVNMNMFQCDICKKVFSNKTSLKIHLGLHSEDKPYKCDLCDFACRFSSGVSGHKLRRHSKTKLVYCGKCGRSFNTVEQKMAHTCKIRSAVCPICGIIKNKGLKEHMNTHNSSFKCKLCPAEFKTRGALKVHMDKHDGYRPYGCQTCSMRFFSYSVMVKHRRAHTEEQPGLCRLCGQSFANNRDLRVHMKKHGGDLVVKVVKNPTIEEE